MDNSSIIIASCLLVLAIAHSLLGERVILGPLFQSAWEKPAPRWAMQRILRFAWHLTSIAWLGMAAAVLGLELNLAIAVMALLSAAIVFFALRGHLAWPLFFLAGVAALHADGHLSQSLLASAVVVTLVCILGIAVLHMYWVVGGRWGLRQAIPSDKNGEPAFRPPAMLTALVAIALFAFAGLVAWTWLASETPTWPRVLLSLAIAVLVVRAIGDGKQVGFSKTQRSSSFAQWDDRLFTPLAVLMAFGSVAALLV